MYVNVTPPRIGILGGMGPAATILLQQRLVDATVARSDADHIRLLIDMNPQVPSRIDYLIHGKGPNPGPVLGQMAQALDDSTVDAIAMPCCTAHHFVQDIENAIHVPFLNMIELTAKTVANRIQAGGRVGILASPATEKIELFKKALDQVDLRVAYPDDANAILSTIGAIKSSGLTSGHLSTVQNAVDELVQSGVDAIIVGCSEFSLMSDQLSADLPIVDAVDVLVEGIISFCNLRFGHDALVD